VNLFLGETMENNCGKHVSWTWKYITMEIKDIMHATVSRTNVSNTKANKISIQGIIVEKFNCLNFLSLNY
jgi:hypothetical protein